MGKTKFKVGDSVRLKAKIPSYDLSFLVFSKTQIPELNHLPRGFSGTAYHYKITLSPLFIGHIVSKAGDGYFVHFKNFITERPDVIIKHHFKTRYLEFYPNYIDL